MEIAELAEASSSTTPASTSVASSDAFKMRLRQAAANIGVALLFFGALLPGNLHRPHSLADGIWIVSAALMGVLSLVRIPPNTSMIQLRSILATAAMMLAPAMMRPVSNSHGLLALAAVGVLLVGTVLGQFSRLYLGRRFGLLPANRGVLTGGPFRYVRHPIYLGWFVLSVGFVMAHPALINVAAIIITLPFMMWRISLEEELLGEDPEYRAYMKRTHYRLIPFVL
jgi:protein-S-isoprenylcysteine O-methyltransferase Ste14